MANYWHGGGLYTHYSLAWHFPERNVALYIVVNGYGGDVKPFAVVEALSYYVADLLLGYTPWVTPSNLCTYPAPWGSANRTKGGEVDEKANGSHVRADGKEGGEGKVRAVAGKLKEVLSPQNVNVDSGTQEEKVEKGDQINNDGSNNDDKNSNNNNGNNNDGSNNNNNDASTSNFAAFQGTYFHPLFGNFSVFLGDQKSDLLCRMRVLTGRLRLLLKPPTFGVELTGSLRFLSKPSAMAPAKNAFTVEFVRSESGEVTAVDINSSWAMEVPVRFQKLS